jgi:DNA-binding GntR family transcriptional regulator
MELKERILSGELEPGQSLIEEAIAAELAISRTPLREAIQRLESEELVIRQPNGRLRIAPISREEVEEIFVIRSMLEGIVARYAAQNATEADIRELAVKLDNIRYATEQGGEKEVLLSGSEFHTFLYQLSGQKTTIKLLNTLKDRISRYRRLIPKHDKGRQGKAIDEHRRIYEYIAAHDPDGAERAMKEHILNSMQTAVDSIRQIEQTN